jgi:hypothetical protein
MSGRYLTVGSVLLALILCGNVLTGQSQARNRKANGGWSGTIGASIGQETFIGAPKLGIYREFVWKHGSFGKGYKHSALYAGAEVSALAWIGTGVYTIGINAGVRHQSLTLDNSLSHTMVTDADLRTFASYNTWNPKVGYQLGPVWLKAGPSFWLSGNAGWGTWMKLGSIPVNLEVHYVQQIK